MGPLVPLIVITTTLTLQSDSKPVSVKVNKPRGTIYWGGAGLDGPYVQPQLNAFGVAGIQHCYVGKTNTATRYAAGIVGTLVDALRAGINIRYEDDGEWRLAGMNQPAEQFNLIGYSYGSLLAAQTARYYADRDHTVNNLVLIGSPIDADFLKSLRSHPSIKKTVVVNLAQYGDPIHAGMTQAQLIEAAPKLGEQMARNKGEGHFYYAHVVADSQRRWAELAQRLYVEGLR